MKKILLVLMMLPGLAMAQKTYWQIEKVKPVIETSLFFEAFLGELTTLDYLSYEESTKELFYYDAYSSGIKPKALGKYKVISGASVENEGKVSIKVIDGKLKIVIYENNNNIAFIICKKAADNETAFLEKVKAGKDMIRQKKEEAINEHPKVSLSKEAVPATYQAVNLLGYSLSLPPAGFFISPLKNGYRFYQKDGKTLKTVFESYKSQYIGNDSLQSEELYPITKEGSLWLSTRPYYYWDNQEKGTEGYVLSNSVSLSDAHANIISTEKQNIESLSSLTSIFRTLKPSQTGLSIVMYNYGKNYPKGTAHTAGSITINLPANYEIRDFLEWGNNFYSFEIADLLKFSSDNPESKYYPIQQSVKDNTSALDVPRGGLYSLKSEATRLDILNIKAEFEKDDINILDSDKTGIIYYTRDEFTLLRYFKKGDTHYAYFMQFPDFESCIDEFGRSKKMWNQ